MSEGFNWTCPHCQRHVTITSTIIGGATTLYHDNADGRRTLTTTFITCPNPECKKFTLFVELYESEANRYGNNEDLTTLLKRWQLIPSSDAKVFPDFIPKPIIADYQEACLIKDLSPKASATLSRRCLQGILRDFWNVKPGRLVDEIDSIKDKVDPLTWAAIDSVRKLGNIGAHMEKDINVMVDVDPNEATLLVNLNETLFVDWYVAREDRKKRLSSIVEASKTKENLRKPTN